ncbi:MAG: hypothetical protein AAFQ94_28565 [Bacteroidota bacterium]
MKKSVVLIYLFLIANCAFSQKSVQELSELSNKKFNKISRTYHGGSPAIIKSFSKSCKKMGQDLPEDLTPSVKKVGILTFYLSDFSELDNRRALRNGGVYADNLTTAATGQLARDFYDQSLQKLKESYKAQGIELLTPDQFLDTEAKKDAYFSTEIKLSGVSKVVSALSRNVGRKNEKSPNAPDGYRVVYNSLSIDGADKKAVISLGKLAKELGLDGLLSVQILTNLKGRTIGLHKVKMALHGINPIPYDGTCKWVGGYFDGLLLEFAEISAGDLVFAKIKKKAIADVKIDGFDALIGRLSDKVLNQIAIDYEGNSGKK